MDVCACVLWVRVTLSECFMDMGVYVRACLFDRARVVVLVRAVGLTVEENNLGHVMRYIQKLHLPQKIQISIVSDNVPSVKDHDNNLATYFDEGLMPLYITYNINEIRII